MILLRRKRKAHKNYTDPHTPRFADLKIRLKHKSKKTSFKVVSYNIKHSKKINKAIHLLGTHKNLSDADVICLQEMTLNAVEKVARKLEYNYVYYPAVFHRVLQNDFGNAILSKWPVTFDEKVILPHMDSKRSQRIAINALVNINGTDVLISCVHFKVLLKPSLRAEQTHALIKTFTSKADHTVLAGDFNTFTKKNNIAVLEPLINADFIPATDGIGWSHKHWTLLNKKTQLDHIFIKGLTIVKTGKVIDRNSSDHIPIWTKLKFANPVTP